MAHTNDDYGWDKHLAEHRRMWETLSGLIDHAAMTDERIEALRQVQLETNASVRSLVGAIRGLIDRIPPENLR